MKETKTYFIRAEHKQNPKAIAFFEIEKYSAKQAKFVARLDHGNHWKNFKIIKVIE